MPCRYRFLHRRHLLLILFSLSLIVTLCLGNIPLLNWQVKFASVAVAQSADASQLVQRGVELYQAGNYQGAIAQWQTALTAYQSTKDRAKQAIVLENLARTYQQIGQSEQAIDYWKQVISAYRQLGNSQQVGRMLVEMAQSYSSLGQSKKAIAILCGEQRSEQSCKSDSALHIARTYNDRLGEAAALGSLGNAYRLRGKYSSAIAYLQASLKIAAEIDNPLFLASVYNNLGNAYISLGKLNYQRAESAKNRGEDTEADNLKKEALSNNNLALKHFQQSLDLASSQNDVQGQMQALLNSIPVYYRTQASASGDAARQKALELLKNLPDSQKKVYATIQLAHLLLPSNSDDETSLAIQCFKPEKESEAKELLKQAVVIAQGLKDRRAESFALGDLGHIYECRQDYQQALELTQQAQFAANQNLKAKDSLYLWEWQAGRILKKQNKKTEAIAAYERSVTILEEIRSDILTTNRDLQFDFRDSVSPIYLELAELSLEKATALLNEPVDRTKQLNLALKTIDSLKLAELQNYFGNDCILTPAFQESEITADIDTVTAIFSFIIFPERTAIIVSLPNNEKRFAWINIEKNTLIQEVNEFRRGLERYRDIIYTPQQAEKLYNWIVRPFALDLEQAQVKTIVFIPDGILRSIPMAALYDGEKFLVEKYAIATTPTLSLINSKTPDAEKVRALAVGLTKEAVIDGRRFPALTNVSAEIGQIKNEIPDSRQLLDENFTYPRLQTELGVTIYPVIHIATHGEFGSVPEDTFLVTGNNQKLTINQLDAAIRNINGEPDSVELLALTACQTAVGDDRAALGLAGVAVQAGVRSALASLWFIDDAATVKLVTQFYSGWHDARLSKAEALRAAQRSLISSGGQYAHPAYWAPFILIGNWL